MAVDYGTKRIGLAICDAEERLASPCGVMTAVGEALRDAQLIADAARQNAAEGLVIGLPLNMDGTEGAMARRHRDLARMIEDSSGLPVELFDERLTSYQADDWMRQSGLSHKQKKARRDALAAVALLQAFLDSRRDI